MKSIFLALALTLISCQHQNSEDDGPKDHFELLHDKLDRYIAMAKTARVANSNFIYANDCDSLLFNGLYLGSLPQEDRRDVDITLARSPDGRWERRPLALGPCYPTNAASSISKDMLLGVFYYAWHAKNLAIMLDLERYGRSHNWVMGEPWPQMASRVFMTPSMVGLMYQIIYKLGGPDHPSRRLPDLYPSGLTGFESHLQVIDIMLRAEISDNKISDTMLSRLREHAARQPHNPFFAAALARFDQNYMNKALLLLLSEEHYPANSLPSSALHCEKWLIQVEEPWLPCTGTDSIIYSGADFIFAAKTLLP